MGGIYRQFLQYFNILFFPGPGILASLTGILLLFIHFHAANSTFQLDGIFLKTSPDVAPLFTSLARRWEVSAQRRAIFRLKAASLEIANQDDFQQDTWIEGGSANFLITKTAIEN